MKYEKLTNDNLLEIVEKYMQYYNNEGGCWTKDTALKRIYQVVNMYGAMCLIAKDENDNTVGFAMGYYKQYDDLVSYYLEEIVVFKEYQNKGYGSEILNKIEKIITKEGATLIELTSVNDEMHMHFYEKFGMYAASNLKLMGKHYKKD